MKEYDVHIVIPIDGMGSVTGFCSEPGDRLSSYCYENYLPVGVIKNAHLHVEKVDDTEAKNIAVKSLKEKMKSTRAEAEASCQLMEERIQSLLAIGHDGGE
jgi:hypothetical protein